MSQIKIIGTVLYAISALVSAAQSILKFIDNVSKLYRQSASCTA